MTTDNVFETDASALTMSDNDIEGLSALAARAKELEAELADLQSEVDLRAGKLRKLLEESIPEAMRGMGVSSFKMSDGSSIEVKPFYNASIKETHRNAAFQWLREEGFDDIIKKTVTVRFGRNETELSDTLLNLLETNDFMPEVAEKVEPQTLKAFVKEQLEKGVSVPTETFGVHVGAKAKIKS